MSEDRPVIAITSGEPAGIGPDIIAGLNPADFNARLILIGDRHLFESRAASLASKPAFLPMQARGWIDDGCIEVLHLPMYTDAVAGQLDKTNSRYVLDTLERACRGCLEREFDAMVTTPIQKDIINDAGIAFTGHTEFLAQICQAPKPVMLLTADRLRVALATTHLPIRQVADAITRELIIEIATILDRDLHRRFGLSSPHIKVCGLNPHAGENGYLGHEEIDTIIPAIKSLKEYGLNISGPYPADTLFTPRALADADVVLAMYHDQGLPVLKHAGFHRAINTTLGLPIIRTSVDHGTALELAGTGRADGGSLNAAIVSAIEQSRCQKQR